MSGFRFIPTFKEVNDNIDKLIAKVFESHEQSSRFRGISQDRLAQIGLLSSLRNNLEESTLSDDEKVRLATGALFYLEEVVYESENAGLWGYVPKFGNGSVMLQEIPNAAGVTEDNKLDDKSKRDAIMGFLAYMTKHDLTAMATESTRKAFEASQLIKPEGQQKAMTDAAINERLERQEKAFLERFNIEKILADVNRRLQLNNLTLEEAKKYDYSSARNLHQGSYNKVMMELANPHGDPLRNVGLPTERHLLDSLAENYTPEEMKLRAAFKKQDALNKEIQKRNFVVDKIVDREKPVKERLADGVSEAEYRLATMNRFAPVKRQIDKHDPSELKPVRMSKKSLPEQIADEKLAEKQYADLQGGGEKHWELSRPIMTTVDAVRGSNKPALASSPKTRETNEVVVLGDKDFASHQEKVKGINKSIRFLGDTEVRDAIAEVRGLNNSHPLLKPTTTNVSDGAVYVDDEREIIERVSLRR